LVYANPLQALAPVRELVRPQADAIAHAAALFFAQILSGWLPVIFTRAEVPHSPSLGTASVETSSLKGVSGVVLWEKLKEMLEFDQSSPSSIQQELKTSTTRISEVD
jgi:hypothetical protein